MNIHEAVKYMKAGGKVKNGSGGTYHMEEMDVFYTYHQPSRDQYLTELHEGFNVRECLSLDWEKL